MIYRVGNWRITWRFLLIYLVLMSIAFLVSFGAFFGRDDAGQFIVKPWGAGQITFLSIAFVLFLATYIPSLRCFYFVVEDKYFILKRVGKDYQYDYANIEFIDVEESQKKKMIIFYSKTAKMRYMLGDKDGEVLKILIEKCPNTISKEEFRRRHPEERY